MKLTINHQSINEYIRRMIIYYINETLKTRLTYMNYMNIKTSKTL